MRVTRIRVLTLFGVLLLAGCAVRRYHSAPIVPSESASRFESRSFADPGLEAYFEKNLGQRVTPWPPKTWVLQTLSLASLYFNPTLDAARARVEEAQCASEERT